jgi:hypothetical protein
MQALSYFDHFQEYAIGFAYLFNYLTVIIDNYPQDSRQLAVITIKAQCFSIGSHF